MPNLYDGDNRMNESKKKQKSTTPMLDSFGRNLTELALKGELDPVIGRDVEVREIVQILNKRKKNNPILIGEPGVGKTAIVEGLAQRMVSDDVDIHLRGKQIIEINLGAMVSGTKYRGEFELRIEDLLKEFQQNPNIIAFIDEIHNIVGAGGAAGALDASNIIKPALANGTLKCIGATTFDEYKKYIEDEGALERRFQKIYVKEPTKEETLIILKNIKDKYEEHHGVIYSDEILEECVSLTDRYITLRKFPDKAIDLMDEIGSRAKLRKKLGEDGNKILEIVKKIALASDNKKEAANSQHFEKAGKYRDEEHLLMEQLDKERAKIKESLMSNKVDIIFEDVASVVAIRIGVPITKLSKDENKNLLNLAKDLKSVVIGQDDAIDKMAGAIQRARIGIQDPNKPTATFMLLGSTGVGKTYLAKVLAELVFNTTDSFIRVDMSEYMEKHSVSKLIGSPPGYVGYESKGQLTEKIKNRPYSLVLFDEIEKAHTDVHNILLQLLDEGKLTDSSGTEVNFKNTIIIMTSNIGTKNLIDEGGLGFRMAERTHEQAESIVFKELENRFKPELLNRMDEKVVFKTLSEENVLTIVSLELKHILDRVKEKGYNIKISDEVKKYIAEEGYSKKYGARPIKRFITTKIGALISDHVLKNKITVGDDAEVIMSKDKKMKLKKC